MDGKLIKLDFIHLPLLIRQTQKGTKLKPFFLVVIILNQKYIPLQTYRSPLSNVNNNNNNYNLLNTIYAKHFVSLKQTPNQLTGKGTES